MDEISRNHYRGGLKLEARMEWSEKPVENEVKVTAYITLSRSQAVKGCLGGSVG